jgi:hypothetical protein
MVTPLYDFHHAPGANMSTHTYLYMNVHLHPRELRAVMACCVCRFAKVEVDASAAMEAGLELESDHKQLWLIRAPRKVCTSTGAGIKAELR